VGGGGWVRFFPARARNKMEHFRTGPGVFGRVWTQSGEGAWEVGVGRARVL
jgi:hypothetical protein